MGERNIKNTCNTVQSLDMYLAAKAQNHNCYKTYTVSHRVQSWIEADCFYLDDGSRWNDIHDRETFNHPQSNVKRFGRCFSFSKSESVAMWMLYGGMQKKGVMLEFTRKGMSELIRNTTHVELGNWVNNKFVNVITLQNDQFDLTLKDILYTGDFTSDTIYIRRSDESSKEAPIDVIRQLQYCVKSVAWSYENECRLILTVNKSVIPDATNVTSVRIPLKGLLKDTSKTRIYCSPNYQGEKDFGESKISEEVDWDLCNGCNSPLSNEDSFKSTEQNNHLLHPSEIL